MGEIGLAIVVVVTAAVLVLLAAIQPASSSYSRYELQRRTKKGDAQATTLQRRESLLRDIYSLLRWLAAVVLAVFVIASLARFGWGVGSALAISVALSYHSLARIPMVRRAANKLYEHLEPQLLDSLERYRSIVWWLRAALPEVSDAKVHSREELEHLVHTTTDILTDNEKRRIISSLSFDNHSVADIMTHREHIRTIKKSEILGPLVLDDLHKTGHSHFPVIEGGIDRIVGILHVRDVLILDTKRKHTATVETAMEKKVHYLHYNQPLSHALMAFLSTHQHLFVVIDDEQKTVGIVSLEDTMEALLGRKVSGEAGEYDDKAKVAGRSR